MLVGPKRLYGLIGHPVSHSLSPVIHSTVFREAGIDAEYLLWDLRRREVHIVVEALRGLVNGFNVTIPYKEVVRRHCDRESNEVCILGAVNTVRVGENGDFECFNTDVAGVERCLEGYVREGFVMLVLGAGGAAKAAILGAVNLGASKILVSNRTRTRAIYVAAIAEGLGAKAEVVDWPPPPSVVAEADVVFNATPLGMEGVGGSPPIPGEALSPYHIVFDAVYRPLETPLIQRAREKGARVIDGLCMLVWQALEADRIWLGIEPTNELYTKARQAALQELQRAARSSS